MKKLLGILVLGLFLITPSQADDIRDFQIEGMSIGDSLLDYFGEDKIKNHLLENGIGTAIHYAVPIHKQPIYSNLNLSLPVSETFANQVLSFPSYPQLTDDEILVICEKINEII